MRWIERLFDRISPRPNLPAPPPASPAPLAHNRQLADAWQAKLEQDVADLRSELRLHELRGGHAPPPS